MTVPLVRLELMGVALLYAVNANDLPVYVLAATFLASVVKQFFDSHAQTKKWKQDRIDAKERREWDREERRVVATTLANNTAVVAEHAGVMATMISQNTQLTGEAKAEATRAYTEANTVNRKIASIGLQMKDGEPLNSKAQE